MLYAIVDIETTGSYAAGSGITEIAVVVHDGKEKLSEWHTLINPQKPIPYFIQRLTGISPEMVMNAPSFEEVAGHIYSLLQDKIFVAHNVNFDYSFVRHHLQQSGYELSTKKLCTIRYARKVVPGHKHYGLGKICHTLGVTHEDHHRALGDAAATARLFSLLVSQDKNDTLSLMLKGRNKEQYLPPNLPVESISNLPSTPGVYYFYNKQGKAIYIGKAINLMKRVKSHFSNNKASRQKQDFLRDIYRISCEPVATDLMAHILESVEIRKQWPLYNRSQRGYHPKYGLYVYEDRSGFKRLALDKYKQHVKPLHSFNTIAEGQLWLRDLVEEFGLCRMRCFNAGAPGACDEAEHFAGDHDDLLSYNERVHEAIKWIRQALPTLALIGKGRTEVEQSYILVENGVFYGMGYLSNDGVVPELEELKAALQPYPDNDYIRNLIYRFAAENPDQCIQWNGEHELAGVVG